MFMTTKTKKITNCKEGRSFFVVLNSSNFWLSRTGVMPFHISPGLDEWHNNHVKVLYVNYFTNLRLKEIRGYLAGPLYQFTSDCKAPSRLKGILFPIYPSFLMRKNLLVSLTVRVEASIHKGKSLSRICVNENTSFTVLFRDDSTRFTFRGNHCVITILIFPRNVLICGTLFKENQK